MKLQLFILFALLVNSQFANAYNFKIKDGYASSIFGTSIENKATIEPAPFTKGELIIETKAEKVPQNFWFNKNLRYAKAIQEGEAPLAILIAGTGGNHLSPKVKLMASNFYNMGYSVVTLPSPSHSNFIVAASSNSSVGGIKQDIDDLKNVVLQISKDLKANDNAQITNYVVGGYSLGAAHSAFLSYYADKDENYPIKFSKVLMVNPPYDILESAIKIDKMFVEHVGNNIKDLKAFFESVYSTIAETHQQLGGIEVGPEIFLEAYKRKNIPNEDIKAAIGTAFRFSSADLVYSVDVMRRMDVIVPPNKEIGEYDVLRPYYIKSLGYGFEKYANDMLTQIYDKPLSQLSEETSMRAIESYLANSDKIYLMHNANDFILKDGDINYFKNVFGDRAVIYPYGGHCGNMDHKDSIAYINKQFKLN